MPCFHWLGQAHTGTTKPTRLFSDTCWAISTVFVSSLRWTHFAALLLPLPSSKQVSHRLLLGYAVCPLPQSRFFPVPLFLRTHKAPPPQEKHGEAVLLLGQRKIDLATTQTMLLHKAKPPVLLFAHILGGVSAFPSFLRGSLIVVCFFGLSCR